MVKMRNERKNRVGPLNLQL